MSEKNKHIVSEELLFRYFAEEVSPDEQEMVLVWKNESESNLSEFNRIEFFFLDIKALNRRGQNGSAYDLDAAWNKFSRDNLLNKKVDNATNWWRIAASILLVFGIGWFTYFSREVKSIEVITSADQQTIELSDGSEIALNTGSQLIYPDRFKGAQRKVQLKGEAYFKIAHDAEKPFLIETDEVLVKVLGTSFNINNSNTDSIVVSVDTGKVKMSVGSREEILTKGYRGIYFKSTEQLVKINNSHTISHNYWRTKTLSFKGATVSEAVKAIEKVYTVKVNFSSPDIGNCKIHVDFENEEVEEVLNIVAETLGLVWSNQGDSYLLAGYGCPE